MQRSAKPASSLPSVAEADGSDRFRPQPHRLPQTGQPMTDLNGGPMLGRAELIALNMRIGDTLRDKMGQEAPLPSNLERLMLALARAD